MRDPTSWLLAKGANSCNLGLAFRIIPVQAGRPNLVSCSEADMHRTALLWYQTDEEKPLPSLDEILIVTPETPREQGRYSVLS